MESTKPNSKATLYNWRNMILYFLIYSILFTMICCVVFYPFKVEGKSLIWKIDGIPQYMLWLQYTGSYIRNLIKQVFDGIITIPMYDFNIGMGEDIRGFFKAEPIEFLGVLLIWGTRGTSKLYNLLTIFRIYLVGVSFSCYGFYLKKNYAPVLAGALTYSFSTYTFYQIERHPQFAAGAILLPLLLIGLEQVIRRKDMLFYSFMVSISLMSSYYFLYINTLIMGIYALLRLNDIYSTNRIKEFFRMLGRIIISYILGCGMSLIFFVPSIARFFLSARRTGGKKANAIGSFYTYGKYRLVDEFLSLTAPVRQGTTLTTISVGVIVIPALVLLFTKPDKKKRSLKLGFLLGLIFLLVPFFGYIFSGFSTVNNRWSFAFVLLLSVIIMIEFQEILDITLPQFIILTAVTVLYAICRYVRKPDNPAFMLALLMLIGITAVIGILRLIPKLPGKVFQAALILVLCTSVALNGYYMNSKEHGEFVNEFQKEATANKYFTSSRYKLLKKIQDDSFYRNDTDMIYDNYNNVAVALKYNGIPVYQSTISSNMINYFKESESIGISALNRTLFLDNRTAQEALACVKYFITLKDSPHTVPYGFELDSEISDRSENYDVYKNNYALPIGYNYEQVISRSQYDSIPAIEKQQLQLDTAVVEDYDAADFSDYNSDVSGVSDIISQGTIEITGIDKGIKHKGNIYKLSKVKQINWVPENDTEEDSSSDSPKIHFSTTSKKNCEVYLRLKGVSSTRRTRADINVRTADVKKRAIIRSSKDTYGLDMNDYLVNLGYYDDDEIINGDISFSARGKYMIDDFEIYYVSMDTYKSSIEKLKTNALENVSFSTNTIEGSTSSDHNHLLAFSIPYHVGWSAFIDGEHVNTYNINTLYMGIKVPAGTHEITLKYHSPGIRVGVAISTLCWYIFLFLLVKAIQKKRQKQ